MGQHFMALEDFAEKLKGLVEGLLLDPDILEVRRTGVTRNNGVALEGLTVYHRTIRCTPVVYCNDFYEDYLKGTSPERIALRIAAALDEHLEDHEDDTYQWVDRFENVKKDLFMELVNYDRNRDKLETCPYVRELDLALVFRIMVCNEKDYVGSIQVNEQLMALWQISQDTLYETALGNMREKWPAKLVPLPQTILDLARDSGQDFVLPADFDMKELMQLPTYVMTNKRGFKGAASIFYSDQLKKLAEKLKEDVLILPSSVHEVILMPADDNRSSQQLAAMVRDINESVITEDEYLSDHVYRYMADEDRIIIEA